MHDEPIQIPLRDRTRKVVAYALVDAADGHLAALTWYLDSGGDARSGPPYVRRGWDYWGNESLQTAEMAA